MTVKILKNRQFQKKITKTPPYRSALNGWWSFMVYLVLIILNFG